MRVNNIKDAMRISILLNPHIFRDVTMIDLFEIEIVPPAKRVGLANV